MSNTENNIISRLLGSLLEGYAWGLGVRSAGTTAKAEDLPGWAAKHLPAPFLSALEELFERPNPKASLMEEVDAVINQYPEFEPLREYLADIVALHIIIESDYGSEEEHEELEGAMMSMEHEESPAEEEEEEDDLDDDDDLEDLDDIEVDDLDDEEDEDEEDLDREWEAMELFFETRGTELIHILNYLKSCKVMGEEPGMDDFLDNFVLDEDEEDQDDIFVYEELIKHRELVEGTLKQIMQTGNSIRDEVIRDLFTPLTLFFRDPEPEPGMLTLAILNQSAHPAIHSAVFRVLNAYWDTAVDAPESLN